MTPPLGKRAANLKGCTPGSAFCAGVIRVAIRTSSRAGRARIEAPAPSRAAHSSGGALGLPWPGTRASCAPGPGGAAAPFRSTLGCQCCSAFALRFLGSTCIAPGVSLRLSHETPNPRPGFPGNPILKANSMQFLRFLYNA